MHMCFTLDSNYRLSIWRYKWQMFLINREILENSWKIHSMLSSFTLEWITTKGPHTDGCPVNHCIENKLLPLYNFSTLSLGGLREPLISETDPVQIRGMWSQSAHIVCCEGYCHLLIRLSWPASLTVQSQAQVLERGWQSRSHVD